MAEKEVSGISGVLGELVSKEPKTDGAASPAESPASTEKPRRPANSERPLPPKTSRARLGRPPGNSANDSGPKEKVTLRIPCKLIAEYRDWSWEARCQLSELVEKALAAYQKSKRH